MDNKSLIMEGTSFEYSKGKVAEGKLSSNMYMASTIGNTEYRDNQEDAALLVVHPKNNKFKMMVVADGVGGFLKGEEASKMLVNQIQEWFENLDASYYENPEAIEDAIKNKLNEINYNIYENGGLAATTFCGAIIAKYKTIVANVGDSRAYVIKDFDINQITEDQSEVWQERKADIEDGFIEEEEFDKDEIRFDKYSNCITQAVGGDRGELNPDFYIIENSSYDVLFLVTDGVSDILSDKQLMAINKKTNRKELARRIIEASLTEEDRAPQYLEEIAEDIPERYVTKTTPGKDNATIVLIDKSKDEDEGR